MSETSQTNEAEMTEIEILARTIYGEARGEKIKGKEAVASVIMNRVKKARARGGMYWWGSTIKKVCLKPWQFSCWNKNDPNRLKILNVNKLDMNFQTCLRISRRAVAGELKDQVDGSTHYHSKKVNPLWSRGRMFTTEIGRHHFYNNVE